MTLQDHLAGGITTACLAWAVTRLDGRVFGFTDHDGDLTFEGILFRAGSGLTARTLEQSTGLSIDNSEAVGAFSDSSVTEEDLALGRFDGAEVRCWMVNWKDTDERLLRFSGRIGEVSHGQSGFRAELRGLAEALNRTQGRVIQAGCDATLGDARCRFDLTQPGYQEMFEVLAMRGADTLALRYEGGFEAGWFNQGRCEFVDGPATGVTRWIKSDRTVEAMRIVELWQEPGIEVPVGALVRLVAGCDKRGVTCRRKFENFANFRGFPNVPTADWLAAPVARRAD